MIKSERSTKIRFLTQKEVAERFRVTPSTILNWRRRGLLEFFQAPGSTRILYPAESVEKFEREFIKKEKGSQVKAEMRNKRSIKSTRTNRLWKI